MIYTKNQKIQRAYKQWQKSTATDLCDVYGRYSRSKENALDYCRQLAVSLNGSEPVILAHNTFMFTVGFFGELNGKFVFVYVTPMYNYYCNAADLEGYV